MAASFDDSLLYKIFGATSDETRAKYNELIRSGSENKRFLSLSLTFFEILAGEGDKKHMVKIPILHHEWEFLW